MFRSEKRERVAVTKKKDYGEAGNSRKMVQRKHVEVQT